METRIFSRFWLVHFAFVLTQSSLGANAALKDFSNVTTKNYALNGYYKFPDGFLVQWGYVKTTNTDNVSVYFTLPFENTNYNIMLTPDAAGSRIPAITAMVSYKYVSSFTCIRRFVTASEIGNAGEGFHWLAMGQGKVY